MKGGNGSYLWFLILFVMLSIVFLQSFKLQKFTSKEGSFSIMLPEQPKAEVKFIKYGQGNLKLYEYLVQKNRITYYAGYSNLTEFINLSNFNSENALEITRDRALNSTSSILVYEKNISINKYPGKEVVSYAEPFLIKDRTYLVDGKLYMVGVVTRNESIKRSIVNRFLDSFTLID